MDDDDYFEDIDALIAAEEDHRAFPDFEPESIPPDISAVRQPSEQAASALNPSAEPFLLDDDDTIDFFAQAPSDLQPPPAKRQRLDQDPSLSVSTIQQQRELITQLQATRAGQRHRSRSDHRRLWSTPSLEKRSWPVTPFSASDLAVFGARRRDALNIDFDAFDSRVYIERQTKQDFQTSVNRRLRGQQRVSSEISVDTVHRALQYSVSSSSSDDLHLTSESSDSSESDSVENSASTRRSLRAAKRLNRFQSDLESFLATQHSLREYFSRLTAEIDAKRGAERARRLLEAPSSQPQQPLLPAPPTLLNPADSELFVSRYAPKSVVDMISDEHNTQRVQQWMQAWLQNIFGLPNQQAVWRAYSESMRNFLSELAKRLHFTSQSTDGNLSSATLAEIRQYHRRICKSILAEQNQKAKRQQAAAKRLNIANAAIKSQVEFFHPP